MGEPFGFISRRGTISAVSAVFVIIERMEKFRKMHVVHFASIDLETAYVTWSTCTKKLCFFQNFIQKKI